MTVFLWILGVLLFLITIILFVPVRYEVRVSNSKFRLKVSWLFLRFRRGDRPRSPEIGSGKKDSGDDVVQENTGDRGRSPLQGVVGDLFKAIRPISKLLLRTLKTLKPNVLRIRAVIGLNNPAETGWLLGILGIISGMLDISMDIKGDFENEIFEYDIYARDAIMLWSLLAPALMFCLSKPGRTLIKKYIFKKDGKNEPAVKPNVRGTASEC